MRPLVSVVIPVLDEARELPVALDHLAAIPGRFQVLVTDGGSSDTSVDVARGHPLRPRLLTSPPLPPGRAAQLNAAAAAAQGDLLLFLHADTRLPPDAYASLAAVHADRGVVGGNFAVRFDGDDRLSRLLGVLARLLRRAGIYYGDSAVFVRPDVFRTLGGLRPLPVMDDYDFVRRLEQHGRTACLPGPAVTSPRRWQRLGVGRTLATWLVLQALFTAGVPAKWLARLYRPAR